MGRTAHSLIKVEKAYELVNSQANGDEYSSGHNLLSNAQTFYKP